MSEFPRTADVVVVGAGICGTTAARSLARRGARVVVIEKGSQAATEQSGRSGGHIRVQGREPAEIPLAVEALRLWHEVDNPEAIELRFDGNLYICRDQDEVASVRELVQQAHEAGLADVRLLDADETRAIVPHATGEFLGAMWSERDGHCDPTAATLMFAKQASDVGVTFSYGNVARAILVRGDAVTGVRTDLGVVETQAVIVAGGIWTPFLASTVGLALPIMPLVLSQAETSVVTDVLRPTLRGFDFGGRQRPNKKLVINSGMNAIVDHYASFYSFRNLRLWAPRLLHHRRSVKIKLDLTQMRAELGARSTVTPKVLPIERERKPNRSLMEASLERLATLFPGVRGARIDRVWAGVIDMSPDGLPIIDGAAGPSGTVFVAGFSGHGLALGPVIGEIAADLALTGSTSRPIAPFRLERLKGPIQVPKKVM